MAYEPIFPVEGNVLGDPELRFTPNGVAVCNLRIGVNDARPEQNNNKPCKELVVEATAWRELAENIAESVAHRTRVTAKVKMTEIGAFTAKNGDAVGTLKVEILEIGPSLRWATASVEKKAQRAGGGNQGGQGNQGGWGNNPQNQQGGWGNQGGQGNLGADPWANGGHPAQQNQQAGQPTQGQGGGWGSDQGWGNGGGQGADPWG